MAKVLILGDIKLKNCQIKIGETLADLCRSADIVFANLEGPIVSKSSPRPDKGETALSSDESIGLLIRDLSINILSLGNNHICDYGVDGLRESINFCANFKIACVGASDKPSVKRYFYKFEEQKVCFMSFAHREGPMIDDVNQEYGPYALPSLQALKKEISCLKTQGYKIIISYHGGEEFFTYPWPRRLGFAEELISSGALLFVSHHSHSIQPVYSTNNNALGYMATGLGNTFFETQYQRNHYGTDSGIALVLDTEINELAYFHIASDWKSGSLNVSDPDLIKPIRLNLDELASVWSKECRQRLCGSLKARKACVSPFRATARKIANPLLFLRRVIKYKNLRDIDIMCCAIPVYGKLYAKKIYLEGKYEFQF